MAENKQNKNKQKKQMKSNGADVVHVQLVLDRSGSMSSIAAATIDGLNGFLAKQRVVPGQLRLSLVDFDSQDPFRIVTDAIPIAEMVDLTSDEYEPRGGTPLLDAIGLAVERCDGRMAANPDEDQVLVIFTDGLENASTDFDGQQIRKLLTARQEAGWAVLFLGANQDSFATGDSLKMRRGNVRNFEHNDDGVKNAMSMASEAVATHRSRGREQRRELKDQLFDETDERGGH